MMTREEVAEIVTYCKDHKMTYKARLEELNITHWAFYRSKAFYAAVQSAEKAPAGEFIELPHSGTFVPEPSFAATGGRRRKTDPAPPAGFKSMEIRTSAGDAFRIQGGLTCTELLTIIQSFSHVQPQ